MRNNDQLGQAVTRYAQNMRHAGLDVTVTEVAPGHVRVSGRDPKAAPFIYTTTGTQNEAVLRCTGCPDWEVDADGTDITVSARRADDHRREHAPAGPEEVTGA